MSLIFRENIYETFILKKIRERRVIKTDNVQVLYM